MKKMDEIILSICVISCNQRDLLKRCMTTVLQQDLPFPYEIIISDDHSTDGTWELIEDYGRKYPDIVKGYHVENEYLHPICTSERCACNKLNAYLHAKGKYVVNVDADDYLIGTDLYKEQVALLEQHPECSLCQHRPFHHREGEDLKNSLSYFEDIPTGSVYDAVYLINHPNLLDFNPGFMMRRITDVDIEKKMGKNFDDREITYFHLLYGDCVWINKHGYVYVMYNSSSICSHNTMTHEEKNLLDAALLFNKIQIIPEWAGTIMSETGIRMLSNVFKYRNKPICLPDNGKRCFKEYEGFFYDFYNKKERTICEHIRAFLMLLLYWPIRKFKIKGGSRFNKTLYEIATNRHAANKIPLEYWAVRK